MILRKLVFLALGFGAGCGIWVYGHGDMDCLLLILLAAVGLSFLTILLGRQRLAAGLLGLILGLGCCYAHNALSWSQIQKWDNTQQELSIQISDYSKSTNYGVSAQGRVTIGGKTCVVQVFRNQQETLEPGMVLTGTFRLRSTTPSDREGNTYYAAKGVYLLAYERGTSEVTPGDPEIWDFPALMRKKIAGLLEEAFPMDTRAFAGALLLGDTENLDYETDTDLKLSGIRHIIAVSGLHVSIFFGALEVLSLRKRYLTALVGFPGLLLFAAVMGFSPSVSRACLMVSLMLLARILDKEYDGPSALAFAAMVILTVNPAAIASSSFQLSAASVAGIFLFQPGIQKWLLAKFGVLKSRTPKARLARWFSSSVSVSLSATILTTPLCAWYFGTVSLVAVVTNLLTLWMVSILFCGSCVSCLLGAVCPGGAAVLGSILSWGFRYVRVVSGVLADFPLSAVYTTSPYIVIWFVLVYALLVAFFFSQNRRPWVLGCCACVGLCLALMASWLEVSRDDVRITVLDVGQGQCVLLQTQGRSFLVDCGGDSDTASAELAAQTVLGQGIHKLDGLILTHCDRDHAGGVPYLLSRLETELVIQPENGTIQTEIQTIYASQNLELTWETGKLQVFAPTFPGDSNESSLCVLLDTEKCDILITGDRSGFGERSLLRNSSLGTVDVLIAGHHGSKNSTCQELLEAVQPQIVCISVGADNPYGHPAEETLSRLASFGCQVYRTDQLGTIIIRR